MATVRLNKKELASVEKMVAHFESHLDRFDALAKAFSDQLRINARLAPCIHFLKYRVKDPDHLRHKLVRKMLARKELVRDRAADIPEELAVDNLFSRVTDLAGIRLIHLHSRQMDRIHAAILEVIEEEKYELLEPPMASCWDSEYDEFYKSLNINTRTTPGYSSVHYVVKANKRTEMTCELQVRTLTDEVWGEVSHLVSYPTPSPSALCVDQLKTLARFTTGCTRLVDAIFDTDRDARANK